MIPGLASNSAKLSLGGSYPPHINAEQAVRGNRGFLGAPWLPQCLMAVPPSVVSDDARACSCAAKVFPDLICQKKEGCCISGKAAGGRYQINPIGKMANSLGLMWGRLV